MRFARLYRASMYLMLFLAALLLSVDSSRDVSYAMLYPLGVAIAGAVAFATIDREGGRGLPKDLVMFLGAAASLAAFAEYYNNTDLLVVALGHWLVYLQMIKYFSKKTVEDDWYLFGIGLVEVVVGVFISQSDEVGVLLLAWAVTSLWTFRLFHLQREAIRPPMAGGVKVVPMPDAREPYPGLLNASFVLSALRVSAMTLAMGFAIFLLMPRFATRGGNRSGQVTGRHLTGFSDTVKLGQMGEILENDGVVMSVEVRDEREEIVQPSFEPLWRGLTLTNYSTGTWSRESPNWQEQSSLRAAVQRGAHQIRQRIKLEPTDNEVLFAMAPVLRFSSSSGNVVVNAVDGSLYRRDLRPDLGELRAGRPGPFDYLVVSDQLEGRGGEIQMHRGELIPDAAREDDLQYLSPAMDKALGEIVRPILDALPPDKQASQVEKARALESYLLGGKFTYSLHMDVVDPSIDPVLDFLVNRKEGHCEYFASALALMCRQARIPARIVNGFKGGDWNSMGQMFVVRQKHAHSWVEVYLGREKFDGRWLVLDPTPGRQRDEVVARVGGGLTRRFRPLSDYLREQWIRRVAGLDRDRQEREIYGPIRDLFSEAGKGFALMGDRLKGLMSWFYFDDPRKFFSVRGFFVSVFTMLILVGMARLLFGLTALLTGRAGSRAGGPAIDDPSLAFYRKFLEVLARFGLERPPAETPREFARRASLTLAGTSGEIESLPAQVVEVFYSKRFGRREIDPQVVRDLEARLDAMEASLSPKAS